MRMASPCAACCFATCKFPNLKKKFLGPPLPNPGDAPVTDSCSKIFVVKFRFNRKKSKYVHGHETWQRKGEPVCSEIKDGMIKMINEYKC